MPILYYIFKAQVILKTENAHFIPLINDKVDILGKKYKVVERVYVVQDNFISINLEQ